jgi:hypothetical protein
VYPTCKSIYPINIEHKEVQYSLVQQYNCYINIINQEFITRINRKHRVKAQLISSKCWTALLTHKYSIETNLSYITKWSKFDWKINWYDVLFYRELTNSRRQQRKIMINGFRSTENNNFVKDPERLITYLSVLSTMV